MSDTLGIDLGTSSLKAGRFGRDGTMTMLVSRPYHAPGAHEVPFDQVWHALCDATHELLAATSGEPPIVGIGIASQTNSFLLIDKRSGPITPVFLWTGDVAKEEAADLTGRFAPADLAEATALSELTGQVLAPKCLRIRHIQPELWERMDRVRLVPDYLTCRLCGKAMTEPSLWSLTGLYDLRRRGWWTEMLGVLGIQPGQLPELGRTGQPAGSLTPASSRALQLPAGIPVAIGSLDHLAGAIAVGATRSGVVSLSTGTASCAVATHAVRPALIPGGVTGPHPGRDGHWYALAWSGLSSSGLSWYAREVGAESHLAELLESAGEVQPGAGGWRAVPRDANNGGVGFEFTHDVGTPKCELTCARAMRAIVERVALKACELVRGAAGTHPVEEVVAIGGGARSDLWLQLLADGLRTPVIRPACLEATLAGAARYAALACGQRSTLGADPLRGECTFKPSSRGRGT